VTPGNTGRGHNQRSSFPPLDGVAQKTCRAAAT
jgi:hypothetical protein